MTEIAREMISLGGESFLGTNRIFLLVINFLCIIQFFIASIIKKRSREQKTIRDGHNTHKKTLNVSSSIRSFIFLL